ncbi:MAG: hypothetical protein CL766_02160 [Chloroflexi bacterium]|nr:hypothetical protein [Chloroflexota bacterium]MCH2304701.1 hypothetical protein [SAR202 cluster bacterium]|tara:strand:+ start:6326 stop:7489 length:1164 start_codon:yes stop_codon:yes gene_type:complete
MLQKNIAAIVTTYFSESHADLLLSNFVDESLINSNYQTTQVRIASLYIDQIHWSDIGINIAKKYNIKVYPSIRGALTLMLPSAGHWPTSKIWDKGDLSVDGVIIIGEHGDYSSNEYNRQLYPRRYFFEQVCGVISTSNRVVPVFNDKHLSYNWEDCIWMYSRAKELDIPLMAGSALPVSNRTPYLVHSLGDNIQEAVSIGFFHSYINALESYGFHALEALQCMVERRIGGESGIKSVQCLEGKDVWNSAQEGLWSKELALAAEYNIKNKEDGLITDLSNNPILFLLEYNDGFKAATLMMDKYLKGFGYACYINGKIKSTAFNQSSDNSEAFRNLALNIESLFITNKAQYPVERTLLVSGALDSLLKSKYMGNIKVPTPHLDIKYTSI